MQSPVERRYNADSPLENVRVYCLRTLFVFGQVVFPQLTMQKRMNHARTLTDSPHELVMSTLTQVQPRKYKYGLKIC